MDCRKARYCLVASFDSPLGEAEQKDLKYHLKDCSDCRHEAFYYRELFAAEKQVEQYTVSDDFNEQLISKIRLHEAQASWPRQSPPARRIKSRWQLVMAPALFAAAAVASFLFFLPEDAPLNNAPQVAQSAEPMLAPVAQDQQIAQTNVQPRYQYGVNNPVVSPGAQSLFRLPTAAFRDSRTADPFGQPVSSISSRGHPCARANGHSMSCR